jgi:hypothetical protein
MMVIESRILPMDMPWFDALPGVARDAPEK